MKRKFLKKVILYGFVDTRKYRYCSTLTSTGDYFISRIPIEKLGYPSFLNDWEAIGVFAE